MNTVMTFSAALVAAWTLGCETRPAVFNYAGAPLEDPVWVDLLTGRVYAFPKQDMLVHSCGVTFVNVPVYDSPCLLTERRVALP